MGKIVFIAGTDTGAGKTVLTALLLAHLRATGVSALAMKPFCSGARDDARLLFELNERQVPIEAVNPFYFRQPLAPLVAARLERRRVSLQETMERIGGLQNNCEILLIEGIGGILVPLGQKFMVNDLIERLRCSVLLAARNRIGVVNHVLLSIDVMMRRKKKQASVVLMGKPESDISAQSNPDVLRELLQPIELFEVPFLSADLQSANAVRSQAKKCEELLTRIAKLKSSP